MPVRLFSRVHGLRGCGTLEHLTDGLHNREILSFPRLACRGFAFHGDGRERRVMYWSSGHRAVVYMIV